MRFEKNGEIIVFIYLHWKKFKYNFDNYLRNLNLKSKKKELISKLYILCR